jgi:hypothetical protein
MPTSATRTTKYRRGGGRDKFWPLSLSNKLLPGDYRGDLLYDVFNIPTKQIDTIIPPHPFPITGPLPPIVLYKSLVKKIHENFAGLKGQCHEIVVEFRPWITSIDLD